MKNYPKIALPLALPPAAAATPIGLALLIASFAPVALSATAASTDAPADGLETITVTARKVSEDLLKVPVAVQVLTAKDLEERNVITFDDLALYTPGLIDDQAAAGSDRADRSFQQFIIRGMNPSNILNPTTSLFINGVPIPADMLQNVGNAERVEVLEGPQSAYFGKDTFAGAINVVSKSPPKELGGYVGIEEGTRHTQDYKFSIGGPLLGEALGFLGSVDYNSHEGSYRNAANPSQHLGDQSTLTGDLTLVGKPTDDLTIKFYGLAVKDHDGPPATGVLLANAAGGIPSQSNCTYAGHPWFCGTLPGLLSTSPAQNSAITPAVGKLLSSTGTVVNPPTEVDAYGLQRNAYFGEVNIDYVIPSVALTLSSLTGVSKDEVSELSDLSNLAGTAVGQYFGATYSGYPFVTEQRNSTVSQEFRASTDPGKPYRFLLGVSYLDKLIRSALDGTFGNDLLNPTETKTGGVFFSVAYDVLPDVTVSLEGRYQIDHLSELALVTNATMQDATYRNFLPRASIQYKFTPDVMAYFTYSEGINTGSFNTQITELATLSPATQKYFTSAPYNAPVIVKPEKLKNYEFGIKGTFLDGRANLAADIYYDKWSDQLVQHSYTIAPNSTNPPNPYGNSPYALAWTDNSGKSTAKGLEVTGNIIPIEHLTLNLGGAINDTRYDNFTCLPCASSTTPVNVDGQYLPNAPKYSGTAGVMYSNTMNLWGIKDWYARADYIYRSGYYLESLNLEKTQNTELVNLRGGFNWDKVKLEGYVTNLFNNKAYTGGFANYNFAYGPFAYYSAVMVGLPPLITGGVRVKYSF